jgi:hypothetical protein
MLFRVVWVCIAHYAVTRVTDMTVAIKYVGCDCARSEDLRFCMEALEAVSRPRMKLEWAALPLVRDLAPTLAAARAHNADGCNRERWRELNRDRRARIQARVV